MTPPVEPSPKLPENPDDRTQSGEFRAVVEPMLDAHDRKMTLRGWLMAFISAVVAVAAVVVLAIIFIDNRVLAQTTGSNAVQSEKHDALKARVETLEKRFDRFEDRTDKQMNAALDALRVPDSKRPPPLDAGDGGR